MYKRKGMLIVDNHEESRTVLADIFSSVYEVGQAVNGLMALEILTAAPLKYCIILTAIELPEMNGLELIEKIKKNNLLRNIPILAIMETPEKNLEIQALNLGAVDVVLKPFDTALIERRVYNILQMTIVPEYKNVMEDLTIKEIENCIKSLGICDCDACKKDLITLTLNRLKPKYVNTERGELMSKVNTLSCAANIEIISTIASAAEIIKKNPRH